MDAKLMICLLIIALAGLFQQTQADNNNCLRRFENAFKNQLFIPEFAYDIEKAVRDLNPKLAKLPLVDLLLAADPNEHPSFYFDGEDLELGQIKCENFIKNVEKTLNKSGCDQGVPDLEELAKFGPDEYPGAVEALAYVEACCMVTF